MAHILVVDDEHDVVTLIKFLLEKDGHKVSEAFNGQEALGVLGLDPKKDDVKLSFEHQAYGWVSFQEALEKVTYNNSRRILQQAHKYLEETMRRVRN